MSTLYETFYLFLHGWRLRRTEKGWRWHKQFGPTTYNSLRFYAYHVQRYRQQVKAKEEAA